MKPVKYLILGSNNREIKFYIEYVKFYFKEDYCWVIKFGFESKWGSSYIDTSGELGDDDFAMFNTSEEALEFFKNNYVNYNKFYGN